MKERSVGKNTVEVCAGQLKAEEVLVENFTLAQTSGHFAKSTAAIKAGRFMADGFKVDEIPAGPATFTCSPSPRFSLTAAR